MSLDENHVLVEVIWDAGSDSWRDQVGLEEEQVKQAAIAAANHLGFLNGQIGVCVTDDSQIHEINVRHLQHDYPTDVISFPYSEQEGQIEGELVASFETAIENAEDAGWDSGKELLLYVIHGVLHIGGLEDHTDECRCEMREAEKAVLDAIGIEIPCVTGGGGSE